MIPSWGRGALLRVSPAGMDAGGTRHGGRLGARSDHQPTRSATALSVGLKNAAALSKAQIHRTLHENLTQTATTITQTATTTLITAKPTHRDLRASPETPQQHTDPTNQGHQTELTQLFGGFRLSRGGCRRRIERVQARSSLRHSAAPRATRRRLAHARLPAARRVSNGPL